MKHLLAACALGLAALAAPPPAAAQAQDSAAMAAQRAAMEKLAWMRGTWRGPASYRTPQGETHITQTERIGPMLDGTILVMEGKGFGDGGEAVFNAFAVLDFDPATSSYSLQSHTGGRDGTFALTPGEAGYVWEIPAGPSTIRYTATLADGVWTEVGDYVMPGQPPRRFFEMTLTRAGDTDWPNGGAMTPE